MDDRQPVIVVSGLPRSGTSLMMQMLVAGGITPLTDRVRQADAHNPRGYFELETVKRLASGDTLPSDAPGKAVKCIHLLLPSLPAGFDYCVLFMRRSLEEVVASQRAMLLAEGKAGSTVSDEQLVRTFQQQIDKTLHWLSQQPNFKTLEVSHRQLLNDSTPLIDEVCAFLSLDLDHHAMHSVIDSTLYRQRAAE